MKIVQEARFGGEGANSDDALEELAETGEDGGTCVGLHAPEIATGVQVAKGKPIIQVTNDDRRQQELREDDADL
jgi:hypothetical protein